MLSLNRRKGSRIIGSRCLLSSWSRRVQIKVKRIKWPKVPYRGAYWVDPEGDCFTIALRWVVITSSTRRATCLLVYDKGGSSVQPDSWMFIHVVMKSRRCPQWVNQNAHLRRFNTLEVPKYSVSTAEFCLLLKLTGEFVWDYLFRFVAFLCILDLHLLHLNVFMIACYVWKKGERMEFRTCQPNPLQGAQRAGSGHRLQKIETGRTI